MALASCCALLSERLPGGEAQLHPPPSCAPGCVRAGQPALPVASPRQASKDCVEKTVKRLRDKLKDRILGQILYIMQVGGGCRGS